MELKQLMEEYKVNDKLLVYALSTGLRQLNDEEEQEIKEEMMKAFHIQDEAQIEAMILKLDKLSWDKK